MVSFVCITDVVVCCGVCVVVYVADVVAGAVLYDVRGGVVGGVGVVFAYVADRVRVCVMLVVVSLLLVLLFLVYMP